MSVANTQLHAPDSASSHHEPVVTLVMAAYNAEDSIERAVKSVMAQTYPHWQLIIIDDGSTDATPDIADNLAASLPGKIQVVHQPNAGVSAVRLLGVQMASGDFIIHFDSDDYAEPGMLALMVEKALSSGADMVVADFFRETPGGVATPQSQCFEDTDNDTLIDMLLSSDSRGRTMQGFLWNKLITRQMYQRAGIDFSEGLSFGEDMIAVIKMLQAGAKVAWVPTPLYHYVVNPGSLVNSGGPEAFSRRLQWVEACEKTAGRGHQRALDLKKYHLKYYGLTEGILSAHEFYSYSSTPWSYLPTIKFRRRCLPAMVLATLRLYPLARLWCRIFGPGQS